MDASISKICGESSIRSLSLPLAKAIEIQRIYGISFLRLATYFKISQSSIKRGIAAQTSGRSIGKSGRPSILQENEEQVLLAQIDCWKSDKHQDITRSELKTLVNFKDDIHLTIFRLKTLSRAGKDHKVLKKK